MKYINLFRNGTRKRPGILVAFLILISLLFLPKISLAERDAPYLIGAGDVLEISVWKEKDLSKQIAVRPDGKFSFPLIGEVNADGQTVEQVGDEIRKRVSEYIPEAVVTVMLLKMKGIDVYVVGKVNKPGQYNIPKDSTFLQALALAGGLNNFAYENEIIIVRSVGEYQKTITINYRELKKGKNIRENIILQDGDVITVR